MGYNKYRKSYDPYDSHDEDDGECPHCNKHSGDRTSGKHSDCCPRYIDSSMAVERYHSDDDLEISQTGSAPKRRLIQPLHPSGQKSLGDDLDMEHSELGDGYDLSGDVDSRLSGVGRMEAEYGDDRSSRIRASSSSRFNRGKSV